MVEIELGKASEIVEKMAEIDIKTTARILEEAASINLTRTTYFKRIDLPAMNDSLRADSGLEPYLRLDM
jgi:hypothetical protein